MRASALLIGMLLAFPWAASGASAATEAVTSLSVLRNPGGRVDWSPDGGLIAYDLRGADGYFDVYTMRPDATGQTCLTCDHPALPDNHIGNPAWHPSGRYLVLQVEKVSHPGTSTYAHPGAGQFNDLWVLEVATGVATAIHTLPLSGDAGTLHPHFSHDGARLSWSEMYRGTQIGVTGAEFGYWTMQVADFLESPPRLANIQALEPAGTDTFYENHGFSPDDRLLYFSKGPGPGGSVPAYRRMDIVSYNLVSGQTTYLTSEGYNEHGIPSPDGRRIVWMSSMNTGGTLQAGTEFWIMDADGSGKRQLTCLNAPGHPHYQGTRPVTAADSSWSPAGDRIAGKVGGIGLDDAEFTILMTLGEGPEVVCPGGGGVAILLAVLLLVVILVVAVVLLRRPRRPLTAGRGMPPPMAAAPAPPVPPNDLGIPPR